MSCANERYSTQQVADLIGIKPDRIRHYVRRKLLRPARSERGHYRFSFQDVVLLRTAKGMTDAAISIRQTNRALAKLQTDLKSVSSLSSVRIYAHGMRSLFVKTTTGRESGQMTTISVFKRWLQTSRNWLAVALVAGNTEHYSDGGTTLGWTRRQIQSRPSCRQQAVRLI